MDYHAIHGHDKASFEIAGTHRLPTVSASQALDELQCTSSHISTGLENLDQALGGGSASQSVGPPLPGGIKRGQLTEIWGPPGSGKTALGLQLTANALCDGDAVVWIDCFQPVRNERVQAVFQRAKERQGCKTLPESGGVRAHQLYHYSCLTLPHLIALVSRPVPKLIPTTTSLIVISSLSALVNAVLPRVQGGGAAAKLNRGPTPASKRVQALQTVINALQKLAATRNCAVVILSQCATRMHSEKGAALVVAINATVWEQGVSTRLVLFRDWAWQDDGLASVFMAGLQKVDGRVVTEGMEDTQVAFKVEPNGICAVQYDGKQASVQMTGNKRKLGQTELEEVPDSEDDEDYGWADEDEAAMPAPPPQWQGSEDILLGQELGRSDESHDEDDADDSNDEETPYSDSQ